MRSPKQLSSVFTSGDVENIRRAQLTAGNKKEVLTLFCVLHHFLRKHLKPDRRASCPELLQGQ